jgi:hypothetical protein
MLFQGEYVRAMDPFWQYIPTWILITTPLLQLGGFIMGGFCLVILIVKKIQSIFRKSARSDLAITPDHLAWLAILGWLFLPLASIFIFHSVLYDAWRQMFFIYPAMLLIAVFGIKTGYEQLFKKPNRPIWLKILTGAILMAGLLEPLVFMVQYHPFENVFFNVFAGDPLTLRQNFEQDYWGLSYKQGIDYILSHDSSQKIRLSIAGTPGELYIQYMLPPEQASRLVIGSPETSDYFISAFRWHPQDYPYGKEYFAVNIRGTKILTVYKVK